MRVCVVRQRLEELVIVFVHLSLLDAPCMSLTLSLIIRYTTSCWGGQVLLGLSYIHPQSSASCTHTHTHIYTPSHTSKVVLGEGRCDIFISPSLLQRRC